MYFEKAPPERLPVVCRIGRRYISRLNTLATRARAQKGAHAARVPREDLLRALLLAGIDLAIQQGKTPKNEDNYGMQLQCELMWVEFNRLVRYHDSAGLFIRSLERGRESCNGALVLLALLLAETEESFFTDTLVPLLIVTKAQP